MIEKINITDKTVVEALHAQFPIATSTQNGLMSMVYSETKYTVDSGKSIIVGTGIYAIRASYYNRAAILMVSNLKCSYMCADDFFSVYLEIETVDTTECKISNTYSQNILLYLTKIG